MIILFCFIITRNVTLEYDIYFFVSSNANER